MCHMPYNFCLLQMWQTLNFSFSVPRWKWSQGSQTSPGVNNSIHHLGVHNVYTRNATSGRGFTDFSISPTLCRKISLGMKVMPLLSLEARPSMNTLSELGNAFIHPRRYVSDLQGKVIQL